MKRWQKVALALYGAACVAVGGASYISEAVHAEEPVAEISAEAGISENNGLFNMVGSLKTILGKDSKQCEYEKYSVLNIIAPDDELNHKGNFTVEICYGVVLNEDGDGKILNTGNSEYNYIHYNMDGEEFKVGDVVETFMIYNPENNYCDDIIERYDFVVEQGQYELIGEEFDN